MEDLKETIEHLRNELFSDEIEHFEKVVDRLEGYELAYSVILKENDRLKKQVEKLQEDIQIKDKHSDMLKQSSREQRLSKSI